MRFQFSILLFFVVFFSHSQEVTVKDEITRQPIFNAAVFNRDKSKSTLTDFDGKADLSIFAAEEVIFFRHVSHMPFSTTKSRLARNSNLVVMVPNENQLQEVVLSVSKFRQSRSDLPQKVVSLSREDILFSNPQTAADLLENSGQVYVQKSQLGGGSPMIRGFATNRLLITVDGVRMNTAIFRGGNVQNVISIDPLSLGRTEVVLGPGSVVYGSDAVGGVMNFYTLDPKFSFEQDTRVSGRAYARYASANNEKTGHFDISVGKEKWAFLSSVSYSDFDDLRMGSHGPEEYLRHEYAVRRDGQDITVANDNPKLQRPTGYDQLNLLEKIRFKPNENWDFSLGLIYTTTSDYPRYDRLYRKRDGELRAAEWYYGPQNWLQTNFQINKKGNGSLYDKAKLTLAYQAFGESRNDRDYNAETLFQTEEQVDAYSLNLDFEKDFNESELYYGIEYILNKVGSHGTEKNVLTGETLPGTSRYPNDSDWQSLAGYGSFQWKISRDLAFQTGARYNYVLLNAEFDDAVYDFPFADANLKTGALTGSAGLSWNQSELLKWKLNFSTAFRAPNIDDVGKIFESVPGMVVVPNADLKPEYAYNSELGVQINIEDIFLLDLTGYYTHLEDALVRRDFQLNGQSVIEYQGEPSQVQAIQNAAFAYVYGFELGAELKFHDALKLVSQLSLTEGKEELDNGDKAPMRHAAPFFANAHLVWEKGKLKIDLFAEYNEELSNDELAPSEQDKDYMYAVDANGNPYSPEWYTLNCAVQYRLSKAIMATAALENITDQRYRPYSSGIAAPGRNFIVALNYQF